MDNIFTDDELKAAEVVENQEAGQEGAEQQQETEQQQAETQPPEQPRGPDGKFLPKEQTEEGKPPEGHVPQGALHAERERRKEAEANLKKANETLAALANLKQQIASRQPQAAAETPNDADPNGVDHLKKRIAELEAGQTRIANDTDLRRVEEAEQAQISAILGASEAAYRQQKPDYDAAINHVINARAQELSLYGHSPFEVRQIIANEAADIARAAISQGRDPAELGYQIAMARGYRPDAAQQGGGAAGKVDAVARAKEQSRSIGQAGGATPTQLTIEQVAQMSPEEFEALYATPDGRKLIDSLG